MKKATKASAASDDTGVLAIMRARFRAFAKLAERAGEGRPLLRGLRVAQDPKADRIVVVHSGSRVEFVLVLHGDGRPHRAEVECRRMDSAGVSEATPIARLSFDETGVVSQSTVPELVNERVDQEPGAWSIVAAVVWEALQPPA